jgi:aerobic-type carbon monoxide dehydrogenase small subunit (CoxS/CutS family)
VASQDSRPAPAERAGISASAAEARFARSEPLGALTDRRMSKNLKCRTTVLLSSVIAMATFQTRVNGREHAVEAAPDTPLLYVLMNDLGLRGPRFGCGLAQCGSCSVLVDGRELRSCVTPISAVAGKRVTTLEGLPEWYAQQRNAARAPELHPLQQALLDEQALQCGYCANGIIIKAAELLAQNAAPTDAEIRSAMNGHLCRCGTYPRIIAAIKRAALAMQESRA